MKTTMQQWTVYKNPRDFPGKWVARKWLINRSGPVATTDMFVANTLAEIRERLPPGLVCIARLPQDDPAIIARRLADFEVWL